MKTKIYLIILILIVLVWFTPVRVENVASVTQAEHRAWQHEVFLRGEE